MLPAIFSLSGTAITAEERALFTAADPAGFVLFRRNIIDREQLRALTDDLRALSGRGHGLPIMIDQEGGRVARMRPPVWPEFPAAQRFADLYARSPIAGIEAVRANARALALMLCEVGVNVNLLPLLDLCHAGGHDVVGDRAFGVDPKVVASLGRAALDGLDEGGCVGVIKHIPGHGRATVDSHHELPHVDSPAEDLAADLWPFERLADAPIAMTAHIVYHAWDAHRPATLSPTVIENIVRGRVGFDGLLLTDDIGMKALSGTAAEHMVMALAAGCDLALHCSGDFDEMARMTETGVAMRPITRARIDRAMAPLVDRTPPSDIGAALNEAIVHRDALLEQCAVS